MLERQPISAVPTSTGRSGVSTGRARSSDLAVPANVVREIAPLHDETSGLVHEIVERHHHYESRELVRISSLLARLREDYEGRHPELFRLQTLLAALSESLLMHLANSESALFPLVRSLEMAGDRFSVCAAASAELARLGELTDSIRTVMSDYSRPDDATIIFVALIDDLSDLDAMLRRHLLLEGQVIEYVAAATLAPGTPKR